jgi:hypothetical protein
MSYGETTVSEGISLTVKIEQKICQGKINRLKGEQRCVLGKQHMSIR